MFEDSMTYQMIMWIPWLCWLLRLLFDLFIMTHLVVQHSVHFPNAILLVIWHFGLICCPIEFFQENCLFQCKMSFRIHNEDTYLGRTFVLKKYANNVPQSSPILTTSPMVHLHVPKQQSHMNFEIVDPTTYVH